MHLISNTKRNVTKAVRHYMVMRLQFRGTVFTESGMLTDTNRPKLTDQVTPKTTITRH